MDLSDAWATAQLDVGETCTLEYGVDLTPSRPLSIDNIRMVFATDQSAQDVPKNNATKDNSTKDNAPKDNGTKNNVTKTNATSITTTVRPPNQTSTAPPVRPSTPNKQQPPHLPVLSQFWCGFSNEFCGQSTTDDIYERTTHVIMAFANTEDNGTITVDKMPMELIHGWQRRG
jgi:hypothetical protein